MRLHPVRNVSQPRTSFIEHSLNKAELIEYYINNEKDLAETLGVPMATAGRLGARLCGTMVLKLHPLGGALPSIQGLRIRIFHTSFKAIN